MTNAYEIKNAPTAFEHSDEYRANFDPVTILATLREQVLARVRQLHPAPGCLPVPTLHVPADTAGLPSIEVYVRALASNLFDDNGNREPRWITARNSCTHLPGKHVLDINELLVRWYRLLIAAAKQVADGCRDTPYDLNWNVWSLRRYLTEMPLPERALITRSATTAQLHDGQEFSLDDGSNWHVCAAGECIGGVAVYTGEHDAHGDPSIARITATRRQECVVRTVPDREPPPACFTVRTGDALEAHDVVLDEEGDFLCRDCGANGSTDGYLVDAHGAQRWHDDLAEASTGHDDEDDENDPSDEQVDDDAGSFVAEPIPASKFLAGDVVHYNSRCSWRIDEVAMDGKRVRTTGVYTQWDWPGEDRVGKPITYHFRAATNRPVTRTRPEPS